MYRPVGGRKFINDHMERCKNGNSNHCYKENFFLDAMKSIKQNFDVVQFIKIIFPKKVILFGNKIPDYIDKKYVDKVWYIGAQPVEWEKGEKREEEMKAEQWVQKDFRK